MGLSLLFLLVQQLHLVLLESQRLPQRKQHQPSQLTTSQVHFHLSVHGTRLSWLPRPMSLVSRSTAKRNLHTAVWQCLPLLDSLSEKPLKESHSFGTHLSLDQLLPTLTKCHGHSGLSLVPVSALQNKSGLKQDGLIQLKENSTNLVF